MAELTLDSLIKEFQHPSQGTIVAIDELDITIRDGEFIVFVGPSGCGKSTTLRCIAGLESVTSGEIELEGESITNKKPRDRDMAMVFQNYALYPHKTARENMGFGLKMSTDLPETERNKRVEDAAEVMGIEDLLEKKPGELSGGQQQRVAVGRAIVREPSVFLMDEPLSNLDAKLRTQMRTEIQNLHQRLNTTSIYVTHDQTEAMTMGDRIAILNNGKLQQFGTPLECYNEPNNVFVAGFIGDPSMNVMNVEHNSGILENSSFSYKISNDTEEALKNCSSELILGIRPEDIVLAEPSTPNSIEAPIDVVEPTGDVSYIHYKLDNKRYTASISGNKVIDEGANLHFLFPEEDIHIFDQESGRAIKNSSATVEDLTNEPPSVPPIE